MLRIGVLLLLSGIFLTLKGETAPLPVDITEAREYADRIGTGGVEGIWEYTGDGITVLIIRDKRENYRYTISVVESADVRLKPGDIMGYLMESAKPGKFRMSLCTTVEHGLPGRLCDCVATLSSDKESLVVEGLKVKVKISGSTILPVFWNKLRSTLRISVDNPLEKLPEGMRRVYPSYDGNGSSRFRVRYL